MADRVRRTRETRRDEASVAADAPVGRVETNELRDELDEILDEIDEALESNAEEFVRSYVQKGGE